MGGQSGEQGPRAREGTPAPSYRSGRQEGLRRGGRGGGANQLAGLSGGGGRRRGAREPG